MLRTIAVIMALGVFTIGGPSAFAGPTPPAKCQDSKAKATGKKAFALLKAFGKNISKNPDTKLGKNISKAESKFTKAFSKAEAKGGCLTNGDAATVEAIVNVLISDVVGSVNTTTTTSTTSTSSSSSTSTPSSSSTSTPSSSSTSTPSSSSTSTTLLLPPLDHYRFYFAGAPNSVSVTVADQWIPTVPVDLGDVAAFLVPVEKDTPIIDPFTHLTAYLELTPPPFTPLSVDIDNQFGPQTLTVMAPVLLLVPTEKFPAGPGPLPPLPRDHFQCYDAVGSPVGIPKTLTDQFSGPDPVTVLDPFLFCNPADKLGEGIVSPLEHLTCYFYDPPGTTPVGPVTIKNQFTAPAIGSVGVFEPFALCVPSAKLAFGPTTTTSATSTSTTSTSTSSTTSTTTPSGFPPCSASTPYPACDGTCPPGLVCQDAAHPGPAAGLCDCVPATDPCEPAGSPPGGGSPACWGDCPPGMVCVDGGGACICVP